MKRSILLAGLICISASAQAADPETFTAKGEQTSLVVLGAENEARGGHTTGKGTTTWADGRQTQDTNSCVFITRPPNPHEVRFDQVCDMKDDQGTFSSVVHCSAPRTDPGGAGCMGELVGKTGAYTGRRGWAAGYGKDGKVSISGRWFAKAE